MARALVALLALTLTAAVPAPPASFAGVALGRYPVGFRELVVRDYSRGWLGTAGAWSYRPVIVRLWYPAAAPGPAMTMRDFLTPVREDGAAGVALRYEREYSTSSLRNLVAGDPARYEALLRMRLPSTRDARPATGSFPPVLYILGQGDSLEENPVLATLLASHGYVVVTVATLGTSERRMIMLIDDPNSYETQVRDVETGLAAVPRDIRVDRDRVGVVGMSMGGIYALLVASRNPQVKAIAGLDASFMSKRPTFQFDYRKAPYYDPMRIVAPVLSMYRAGDQLVTENVDALQASNRVLCELPATVHGDYNAFPWFSEHLPPALLDAEARRVRTQAQGMAALRTVDTTVIAFLDASLKQTRAFAPPAPCAERPRRDAPTEEELASVAVRAGYDAARAALERAMTRYPGVDLIRFAVLNRIGYEYVYTARPALAVDVFRLNTIAHPSSADAFESLGEGYEAVKRPADAIAAYQKALALDPANADAAANLKKLQP